MKKCCIENCDNKHYGKGFCSKHYARFKRHGDPSVVKQGGPKRGPFNDFEITGDIVKVHLTNGEFFVIDAEDLDKIKRFSRWHRDNNGYIRSHKPTRQLLHRLILDVSRGQVVDHRNHDPADNRKANLRICSAAENNRNSRPRSGGSSVFKGVSYYKQRGKWQVHIGYNGKRIYLGLFDDEEEAAAAYRKAADELFGDFACY